MSIEKTDETLFKTTIPLKLRHNYQVDLAYWPIFLDENKQKTQKTKKTHTCYTST